MDRKENELLGIFAAALAIVVAVAVESGGFDLWDTMIGGIFLVFLLSFRDELSPGKFTGLKAVLVGAIWSMALILVFGILLEYLFLSRTCEDTFSGTSCTVKAREFMVGSRLPIPYRDIAALVILVLGSLVRTGQVKFLGKFGSRIRRAAKALTE